MKVAERLEEIQESKPCSLALGTFDGLHRGHRAVIQGTISPGPGRERWESAVFTFSHSPSGSVEVMTAEDKETLLEAWGVRRLYRMDFAQVRGMEAEAFVREVLFERCRAKRLCCGEDFRFGRGAAGDVSLLRQLCSEEGIELFVAPPVLEGNEKVSSTRIRKAVEQGNIPLANRMLGRPFGFSLEVIHGNHIGTGLGTPTINQAIPEHFALPPFGVYASWVQTGERYHVGVTNIGVKPTVGSDKVLAETWMPDFSGDLYGRQVRILLLDFVRPERKFSSLSELKEEIQKNAEQAKEIAAACPPPEFALGKG